ncbi:MAG: metal-sensitive transcriptional regulator [Burkholderiales bacterium]|nr:MAG: metal-sensitive transcriptional regulator [Betaproteobacteria bacterium]TAG84732.1 MAG: metal-sensitive transcriptional regulator [Burkholderiales bacterium]
MNSAKKIKKAVTASRKPASAPEGIAPEHAQALISRLRRAEGQVRAVARLIEEGHGCDTVAQQLTAARKALDKSFFALVGCAVEHGQVAPDEVSALLAKYA